MSLPASDNFNRPSEYPLAGNWTTAPGANAFDKSTTGVYPPTSRETIMYWNADAFGNDQYSQVKLSNMYGNGPAVRIKTSGTTINAYLFISHDGTSGLDFYKCVEGSYSQIGSTHARTNSDGDIFKLVVTGTAFDMYVNGDLEVSQTDLSLSSGSAGMIGFSSYKAMDDWEGGDVAAGGGRTTKNTRSWDLGVGAGMAFTINKGCSQ